MTCDNVIMTYALLSLQLANKEVMEVMMSMIYPEVTVKNVANTVADLRWVT